LAQNTRSTDQKRGRSRTESGTGLTAAGVANRKEVMKRSEK